VLHWVFRLISGLVFWLVGGMAFGLAVGLVRGLSFGIVFGLAVGLIGGASGDLDGFAGDLHLQAGPRDRVFGPVEFRRGAHKEAYFVRGHLVFGDAPGEPPPDGDRLRLRRRLRRCSLE
jgi:hypothetical protein